MIGLIRVVSSLTDAQLQSHADALARVVDDEIVTRAIPDQPSGIHDGETFARAVPKIVEVGRQLVHEGAKLVIVSCAADPALRELRDLLAVPVVGAGSAGAALALASADRIGVLGITHVVPVCVTEVLGTRIVADRVPEGVSSTVDLMRPAARERALVAADEMKAAGAQAILFACTGLTTIGLADEVTARTGLPVVDAVLAAGTVANALIRPPQHLPDLPEEPS